MQVFQRFLFPQKIIRLGVCATTRAPRGVYLHQDKPSCRPGLHLAVRTYASRSGNGMVSVVDAEDTQTSGLLFSQLLHGPLGPCIVMLQQNT